MAIVSDDVVQGTLREVLSSSPFRMATATKSIGENQPYLLGAVQSWAENLSANASQLLVFMFFVVHRMFERARGEKLATVSAARVIEVFQERERQLSRLEDANARFLERVSARETARQPHVLRYVLARLADASKGDVSDRLSEEEAAMVFFAVEAAVYALDVHG